MLFDFDNHPRRRYRPRRRCAVCFGKGYVFLKNATEHQCAQIMKLMPEMRRRIRRSVYIHCPYCSDAQQTRQADQAGC